ncbi:hypothetical protein GCK72_007545 [Caenorhabditis remanei]|uniref:BTB domain-containing protein n=1 Tax=Caenorhabditis remanei TaxID=31234 RepID=A0A6A5HLN1_CAERE|nr:hypothetical protein GCK72_007545 [Caenorhabditis remanei]KAF1767586.1 hypothetical protein GCK72_007545 [Caenorhabditis remanei]
MFQSTHSTLTKFIGYFRKMLETFFPIEKDQFVCIFIDRDPTHFQVILNFMRDGDVDLPDSQDAVKKISREANFYLLEGLVELCNRKLNVPEPENVSKMRFLESDDDVLRAIAYPEKVCKPWDRDNDRLFDIFEFLKKYETEFDIYFRKRKRDPEDNDDWMFCIYYKNRSVADQSLPSSSQHFDTEIQQCIEKIERLESSDDY